MRALPVALLAPSLPEINVMSTLAANHEIGSIALPAPQWDRANPLLQILANRRSAREFSPRPLPPEVLSTLLWAAYGVNRPRHGGRTAPSAHDWQEIEVFAAQYTTACYYLYLSSRKTKILSEYRRASENTIDMDEQGRIAANASRDEIIAWLEQNKGGIPFP